MRDLKKKKIIGFFLSLRKITNFRESQTAMRFQCIQQNCVPETKHSGTRGLLQSTVLRKMDICVYLTKTLRNCLNFVTHPLLYGYSKVINTYIRASFKQKKIVFRICKRFIRFCTNLDGTGELYKMFNIYRQRNIDDSCMALKQFAYCVCNLNMQM